MVSKTRTLALLILLVLSMARVSLAQRTTATFAGIAQDSTGAVLPGVEASLPVQDRESKSSLTSGIPPRPKLLGAWGAAFPQSCTPV